MIQAADELSSFSQEKPLAHTLGIPEKIGYRPIGVLILCGQGPVQEAGKSVKLKMMEQAMPGSVKKPEANTWMKLIARAAGQLDKEKDVSLIIPSGKATGEGTGTEGSELNPTEADLMTEIIENVYGINARVERERLSKNTLYNFINSANIIDQMGLENPNDPNLKNIWMVGAHFHTPRLKVLASLFGFDPQHVISAEDVLMAASKIEEKGVAKRGQLDPDGFNKQQAFQELLRTRIEGKAVDKKGQSYFNRKKSRAEFNLDTLIDKLLEQQNVQVDQREAKKSEIKAKLYIEEQKDAQMRMKDERKWVRGLATQIDYVLPLAVNLISNTRLRSFLLKFDQASLASYNIDRKKLEDISDDQVDVVMNEMRKNIDPKRWRHDVVKGEWGGEEYLSEVIDRFKQLGIHDEDIGYLSRADVPPLRE